MAKKYLEDVLQKLKVKREGGFIVKTQTKLILAISDNVYVWLLVANYG
jgi:hypothetical protein